ncbi:hypothetical protein [Planococcus sp. YIM B11945]|uniref:hypothetical protein n=1 Tax=Planococcus sp. YIM B11945 TaxID=3435410 RepID=UPI003D7EEAAE
MKYLFWAIFGAAVAWLALGFLLDDWDMRGMVTLITGIVSGFFLRKQTEDKL